MKNMVISKKRQKLYGAKRRLKAAIVSQVFAISIVFCSKADAWGMMTQGNQIDWDSVKTEIKKMESQRLGEVQSKAASAHLSGHPKKERREEDVEDREKEEDKREGKGGGLHLRIYGGIGASGDIMINGENSAFAAIRVGVDFACKLAYIAIETFATLGGQIGRSELIGGAGGQLKLGLSLNHNYTNLYLIGSVEYMDYILASGRDLFLGFGAGIRQNVTKRIGIFLEQRTGFPLNAFSNPIQSSGGDLIMIGVMAGIDFFL